MIRSFLLACSFLTILPVPRVGWAPVRGFCLMLPLTGVPLGALWAGGMALSAHASPGLRGLGMALFTLALTGGLHMDGLMDTCDALFSRQSRPERLRILSDPHTGAFGVMGCWAVLSLRGVLFAELAPAGLASTRLASLALIPIFSRLGMAILLNTLPFAKPDGLARTLGASRIPGHTLWLSLGGAALAALSVLWGAPLLPVTCLALFLAWRRCCLSVFGGVTGDLLGAFLELSETAMLLSLRLCT